MTHMVWGPQPPQKTSDQVSYAVLSGLGAPFDTACLRRYDTRALVGQFRLTGATWESVGPVALDVPAIPSVLVTAVADATHLTVSDGSGVTIGDTYRWWDTSAAAELGDVVIAGKTGNDLELAGAGIAGAAADDQGWLVTSAAGLSVQRPFTVGDATRDIEVRAGTIVTFPGTGISLSLVAGTGVGGVWVAPMSLTTWGTLVASFSGGLGGIPDVDDEGVELVVLTATYPTSGAGVGYMGQGGSVWKPELFRGGVSLVQGIAGNAPATHSHLELNVSQNLMRGNAPFSAQKGYTNGIVLDIPTGKAGIALIGDNTTATLTSCEVTRELLT